eukprot:12169385-Alexandrium_andersonii.AAC.1
MPVVPLRPLAVWCRPFASAPQPGCLAMPELPCAPLSSGYAPCVSSPPCRWHYGCGAGCSRPLRIRPSGV